MMLHIAIFGYCIMLEKKLKQLYLKMGGNIQVKGLKPLPSTWHMSNQNIEMAWHDAILQVLNTPVANLDGYPYRINKNEQDWS